GIFDSTASIRKNWCRGGSAFTSSILECSRRRQNTFNSGRGAQSVHLGVFEARPNGRGVDVFRVVATTGERFCSAIADKINNAGLVDRWRQIVGLPARRTNEIGRRQRHCNCLAEYWSLDFGRKAEGNH